MSSTTLSDLTQIDPTDYEIRDQREIDRLKNELISPLKAIIIPNPEILLNTIEDEAPWSHTGRVFLEHPEELIQSTEILPKLLIELQRLNKKGGGVNALIQKNELLDKPTSPIIQQKPADFNNYMETSPVSISPEFVVGNRNNFRLDIENPSGNFSIEENKPKPKKRKMKLRSDDTGDFLDGL